MNDVGNVTFVGQEANEFNNIAWTSYFIKL